MKTSVVAAVGGLAALGIAGAIIFSMSKTPTETTQTAHPNDRSVYWVCIGGDEFHDFEMTVGELAKFDGHCPECGSEEVFRALPCPECGRHYPIGSYNASPTHCKYCDAELPGGTINIFHGQEGH